MTTECGKTIVNDSFTLVSTYDQVMFVELKYEDIDGFEDTGEVVGLEVGFATGGSAKKYKKFVFFGNELLHGTEEGLKVGKFVGIWVEGLVLGEQLGLVVGVTLGTSVEGEVDGKFVVGETEGNTKNKIIIVFLF